LPEAFQKSSGWVDAEVIDDMCRGGDSYSLAGFSGFKATTLPEDWLKGII
jgi:hypothetical protein